MTQMAHILIPFCLICAALAALWGTGTFIAAPQTSLGGFVPFFVYITALITAFVAYGETYAKSPAGLHIHNRLKSKTLSAALMTLMIIVALSNIVEWLPSINRFVLQHKALSFPILLLLPVVGLSAAFAYTHAQKDPAP